MHRAVPLAFVLLVACNAPLTGTFDAGQAACFQPGDGGVFLNPLVSPVPGCALTGQATGLMDLRTAGWAPGGGVLVVPASLGSEPLPVVIAFHGAFGSGEDVRQELLLEGPADGGAIFIYPNATNGTWDIGRTSPDGRLVDRLIRKASETYCIDPQRIFLSGFSAGAVFTHFMGCNEADTFAGIAPVAGTDIRFDTRCCTRPISALLIHGTLDGSISFQDGVTARDNLLERDRCTVNSTPDGANCVAYSGCTSGKSVDWCQWDGPHQVPDWGGEAIWSFFAGLP